MIYLFFFIITISVIISWILIHLKRNTKTFFLKLFMITAMFYLSLCIFFSFESVKGWPSSSELPETFIIHSFIISEPNKFEKTPGAIYFWIIPEKDIDECPKGLICIKTESAGTPKSYKLPYSKKIHQKVMDFAEEINEGQGIVVQRRKGSSFLNPHDLEFITLPEFMDELNKK